MRKAEGMYVIAAVLYCLLLLSHAPEASAQSKRPLSGRVLDGATGKPLSRVEVRTGKYSRRTNSKGEFSFNILRGENLVVSSVGYNTRRIPYSRYRYEDSLLIYISPAINVLRGTDGSRKSELIYQKSFENVRDFAFINDTLVVLSFMEFKPRTPAEPQAYLGNALTFLRYGKELKRITLPDHIVGLYEDLFGNLYVVGVDYYLEVLRQYDGIRVREVDPDFFESRIIPLRGKGERSIFFTEMLPIVPQVNYGLYMVDRDSTVSIRTIRNERYFKEAPSDFRMLNAMEYRRAQELEEKYGIDAMYFAPYVRSYFTEVNYAYPHTEAVQYFDQMVIFDQLNAWIFHHDMRGLAIDSVPMYHHQFDNERYKGMVQDKQSGRCYAIFTKGGGTFLRHVSPMTGAAGHPIRLKNRFPRQIKVEDGWVYYVHRGLETGDTFKITRESLLH